MAGRNQFRRQLEKLARVRARKPGARPFQPGNQLAVGHGRPRISDRDLYDKTIRIYREYTPTAARAMIKMAEEAENENVRLYALNLIMERAHGKPRDFDPEKDGGGKIDVGKLSDEDLATMIRIMRQAAPAIEGPVSEVEGEVVDTEG